jgi:hypothetical protein
VALLALTALANEPVHVVATFPAGLPAGITAPANASVCEFVPHSVVLDRAARRAPRVAPFGGRDVVGVVRIRGAKVDHHEPGGQRATWCRRAARQVSLES